MTEPRPDVSVVVPAYNRPDLLERCLRALEASRGARWEALVVDNASPEDLSAVRSAHPGLAWLRSETNLGYAGANARGFRDARGRYLCYLNADAEVRPDTLALLVAHLDAHPEAGAAVARCVGPDGLPQPILSPEHSLQMAWWRDSALHLLWPGAPWFRGWLLPEVPLDEAAEVPTAQSVCMLVRRAAHDQIGPMDADLFLFYNDVDLCRRLRTEGWTIRYLPHAEVLHHGSASVETAAWKERQLWRDRARFFRKWYGSSGVTAVACACLSRWVVRLLAQLARGRWHRLPAVAREGWELLRGIGSSRNGP